MAEINKDENETTELVEELDTTTEEESPETEIDEAEKDEATVEEPTPVAKGRRTCKGLFAKMDASEFTQNENYSDRYLKSKGLFKTEE